jgi:hypothetical protein
MIFNSLVSSIPAFRLSINELMAHPWIKTFPVDEAQVLQEMNSLWV